MARISKTQLLEEGKIFWEEWLSGDNTEGLSRAAAAQRCLAMCREDSQQWFRFTQIRAQIGLPELDPVEIVLSGGNLKERAVQNEAEIAAQIERNNAAKKPPAGRRAERI